MTPMQYLPPSLYHTKQTKLGTIKLAQAKAAEALIIGCSWEMVSLKKLRNMLLHRLANSMMGDDKQI